VRPTQADNLPPYVWKHIPNVRPLSAKFKSIYWLHVVQGHLANLGIKDVIDKLIDRPDESHPKYNDWVRWSQRVDRWLFSNVGEKIKNRLQKAVPPLEYADMTMEQILLLEPNADDRMNIEALDLWNMHRTNYATAFEYVEAWNDQVQHCRRLDIGIGYYLATKIMMQELSIEYPVVTAFVHNEMREQDKAAHKMDEKSFAVVVDGMRGVALRREYPFVASTAPATE
jgi:hypothetical protein